MKKRFLLMTMVLAVGLGGSGCVLSGNRGFETITDADISNAEENDVSEEETLIVERGWEREKDPVCALRLRTRHGER